MRPVLKHLVTKSTPSLQTLCFVFVCLFPTLTNEVEIRSGDIKHADSVRCIRIPDPSTRECKSFPLVSSEPEPGTGITPLSFETIFELPYHGLDVTVVGGQISASTERAVLQIIQTATEELAFRFCFRFAGILNQRRRAAPRMHHGTGFARGGHVRRPQVCVPPALDLESPRRVITPRAPPVLLGALAGTHTAA